jgi:hypothetical protein
MSMFARIHPAALAGVFVLAAPITCTSDGQASHTAPKPPQYGTPSNLGIAINSDGFDGGPSISADALTIYFISDRAGGSGGGDIWSATRPTTADAFANPKNLGLSSTPHETKARPTFRPTDWSFSSIATTA